MSFPSFASTPDSPVLPPGLSGVALKLDGDGSANGTIARGHVRILAADRSALGAMPLREQVWLLVVLREQRLDFSGAPGRESILFPGEEPATGTIEGWFHARLGETCRLPKGFHGLVDVMAVLGPWSSPPIETTVRPGR